MTKNESGHRSLKHKLEIHSSANNRPVKEVKIHPKHAKPYRKRHLGLLIVSLAIAFFLLGQAVSINIKSNLGKQSARDFFKSLLGSSSNLQTLSSDYGFTFTYNSQQFYASAIDGQDGGLYIGQELATPRPYETFKLSAAAISNSFNPNSITINYLVNSTPNKTDFTSLENQYIATSQNGGPAPVRVSTQTVTINGIKYQRTVWRQPVSGSFANQLNSNFVTYITLLNGKAFVVRTNDRFSTGSLFSDDIDSLVNTIEFTSSSAPTKNTLSASVAQRLSQSQALLNNFQFASIASPVQTEKNATTDQLISALYSPAAVKIYNAYCMDVLVNGQTFVQQACNAESGSGFFINSNGYIGTNGHVATSNPKDIALEASISQMVNNGDATSFLYLAQLAGISQSELQSISDPNVMLDTVCNAVYKLPDSMFTQANDVHNLLVDLTPTEPDVNTLLNDTQNLTPYPETSNIKAATLVAYNYRALDGIVKFRDSDVAIIKINGSNYPDLQLGSINELTQGSDLIIMGYPGAASNNGLVSGTQDVVTITDGHVSAIKNALGDTRKLIQTDAIIGHGSSGSPVFDDNGNVVGIATYGIDPGGGNGTYNYIRDIADMISLANGAKVTYNQPSTTQLDWNKAIDYFYNSHYSAALPLFNQVKSLYPQHPTVSQFIANAQTAIKEGKDVPLYPIWLFIAGGGVALLLVGVAVFLIVRHHGKHQVYKMATGQTTAVPVGGVTLPPANPVQPSTPQPSTPQTPATQTPPQPQSPAPVGPNNNDVNPPQTPQGPVIG